VKVIGNLTKDAIIRAAVSEGQTFTQAIGTPVDFDTVATTSSAIAFDSSNNKVVVAYTDQGNSYQGRAVVGTVDASNNSISFGTPVTFHAAEVQNDTFDVVFDSSNNKVVICYSDSSDGNECVAKVGTVSGTSISFGSAGEVSPNNNVMVRATFDSSNNKVVVVYKNTTVSNYGYAAVGTVSGTSISFGTPVVFNSGNSSYMDATFDSSNNKVVISYRNQSTTYGTAIVGTVSGTSISFGTAVAYTSSATTYQTNTFDSTNNKVVIAYNRGSGYAIVGTVSGTSISFGSQVQFDTGSAEYNNCAFDSNTGKVVITYNDGNNSNRPTFIAGEVSGTSISFDTPVTAQNETTNANMGITFDSNAKKIVGTYKDSGGGDNRGEAVVLQTAGSTDTGGTIADGSAVIVNANGTVSSVSQTAVSQVLESSVVFDTQIGSPAVGLTYDSTNNKSVVAYRNSGGSNKGSARVGTLSSNTISFGTEADFESGQSQYIAAAFDSSNNKVVIFYQDQSNSFSGTAAVGTISGTDITFGTPVVFQSGETTWINADYDVNAGKMVCVFRYNNGAYAIVGTVSGTSISFGSAVNYGATGLHCDVVYHAAAQKVVAVNRSGTNNHARVGTVSGTSISFGSAITVNSSGSQSNNTRIGYDSANEKVVIAYKDEGNSGHGYARVGTVSGTDISVGSQVRFENGTVEKNDVGYHSASGKIIIVYKDTGNSNYGTLVEGTVSGTSISFDTPVVFKSNASNEVEITEDTGSDRMLIAYQNASNGSAGELVVYSPDYNSKNLTSENFVGFMDGAALDGTNGEILSSCSIARNQTSLTAGQTYFVTPAGALSETAGSPSVTAGTAISSTEIIVKG